MNKALMADSLETERLVLFPYTAENLRLFNSDLARFEALYGVVYRGEELDHLLSAFLQKLEKEIADDPGNYLFFTEFLLVRKADSHVIGSIDYKYVPKDGVTEVGYGMNPAYTGRGYMTEALTAFLEFGRSLGIRRVLADTLPDNTASQNVLKRCGFRYLKKDGNLWWEKELDGSADNALLRELLLLQDPAYRDFQGALIPNIDRESMIGVRTPELRRLAKKLAAEGKAETFLAQLPHRYFDENQLHAFIISDLKDFGRCLAEVERFLPYVNNWAACDQMSPKIFRRHRPQLLEAVRRWLASSETYTVRFGIGMLMEHFLDEDFDSAYPEAVAKIRSEEYYVRMMIAWYFATALAKQYEAAVPYLEEKRLDPWTHNKAVQKAVESRRISGERKEYLKSLKLRPC